VLVGNRDDLGGGGRENLLATRKGSGRCRFRKTTGIRVQETTVEIDSVRGSFPRFALLEWEGQPLKYRATRVSENFALQVRMAGQERAIPSDPASNPTGRGFWQTITSNTNGKGIPRPAEIALSRRFSFGLGT
jgi:hypothetical protein